jgi:hypothetical protein
LPAAEAERAEPPPRNARPPSSLALAAPVRQRNKLNSDAAMEPAEAAVRILIADNGSGSPAWAICKGKRRRTPRLAPPFFIGRKQKTKLLTLSPLIPSLSRDEG